MTTTYYPPMFSRLEPRTPWTGSRMTETDILTLVDAASMATKHARTEITQNDILRAASRGEIQLLAVANRDAIMRPCRSTDKELQIPKNSIPPLPLTACRALANIGCAQWRHIDSHEKLEEYGGEPCRFIKWQLPDDQQDLITNLDDCRVTGYNLHALADTFLAAPLEAESTDVPGEPPAVSPAAALPALQSQESAEDAKQEREDWIIKSLELANEIGLKKFRLGTRQITARSICDAVATELEKGEPGNHQKYHGNQGPRAANAIRNVALKGWKFIYPSGTSGINGTDEITPE